MMLLWLLLVVCWTDLGNPEVVEPGPTSGIVLKDRPGLLITNCRLHTQKVFVRLNPEDVFKNMPTSVKLTSWAGTKWNGNVIKHAEADISHMLKQLQKFTITKGPSGDNKRSKRQIESFSGVASVFSLGLSIYNTISISTVQRHVSELQAEIPTIRAQIQQQQKHIQTIGKTLKNTVLVVNSHSVALNATIDAVNALKSVLQTDYAYTQLVTLLMHDILRDISSSVDNLAMSRIPPYLVSMSMVEEILSTTTQGIVTPLQAQLAYTLGSAIPIYVNPEEREMAFLINLPIMTSDSIYRLKDVVNVGSWQGDMHVKVRTPAIVAYHDSNPELYLAPSLNMCTLTKDIHYLCPTKPFVHDSTNDMCGLKPMTPQSKCTTTVTARNQVTETQAEIVGGRWLVNTPLQVGTLTYDQHDTSARITLPNQTFWVNVPPNAILHIGNAILFHLNLNQYEVEIEVSQFFAKQALELQAATITQIKHEGTQTIDITLVDEVMKEIENHPYTPIQHNIQNAWFIPIVVLSAIMGLGFLMAILGWRRKQRNTSFNVSLTHPILQHLTAKQEKDYQVDYSKSQNKTKTLVSL